MRAGAVRCAPAVFYIVIILIGAYLLMYLRILKKYGVILFAISALVLGGCKNEGKKEEVADSVTVSEVVNTETDAEEVTETSTYAVTEETQTVSDSVTEDIKETVTEVMQETEAQATAALETEDTGEVHISGSVHMVAIDAGHQQYGNSEQEPVGPGASQTKAKVTGGTSGVVTGIPEYQLNLSVAMKLKDELISRGYQVYMIRESNEVDISNSERAEAAYNAGADILVRIHANGSEDSSVNGAMTICMTPSNPYNAYLYEASRRLSESVLNQLVAATGVRKEYVWETDTMSGINWSKVPVTIVEMGYMSNPDEDRRMADEGYQRSIARGIAEGIGLY